METPLIYPSMSIHDKTIHSSLSYHHSPKNIPFWLISPSTRCKRGELIDPLSVYGGKVKSKKNYKIKNIIKENNFRLLLIDISFTIHLMNFNHVIPPNSFI